MLSKERGFELYESSTTVNPAAKSSNSPRMCGGTAFRKALAIASGVISKHVATAAAASAFIRLWRPVIGSSAPASPRGVLSRKRFKPKRDVSMSVDMTSAACSMPKVTTGPLCFSRIAITSLSSAFSTAVPPGFRPSISSALAAAMFSIDPRYSKCTGATSNSTPMSGGVIRHKR